MIRIRPIGMALFIMFMIFGPHGYFSGSRGSASPAQSTPLSWTLPDASDVGDRPTRGDIDAVQTKEGWKVRVASRRQMIWNTIIAAVIIAFAWPLRKMVAKRRNTGDSGAERDN